MITKEEFEELLMVDHVYYLNLEKGKLYNLYEEVYNIGAARPQYLYVKRLAVSTITSHSSLTVDAYYEFELIEAKNYYSKRLIAFDYIQKKWFCRKVT